MSTYYSRSWGYITNEKKGFYKGLVIHLKQIKKIEIIILAAIHS